MRGVEAARASSASPRLPLVAALTIDALREYPALNARLDGDDLHPPRATSTSGSRSRSATTASIVPVIHDAQDLSAEGLAEAHQGRRAARARVRQLGPDEVRGGTFTITNPGAASARSWRRR